MQGQHRYHVVVSQSQSQTVMSDSWNPMDRSPKVPLSMGFSRQEYWSGLPFMLHNHYKVKVMSLSHVRLFATPWTVAHQAPPSMEFSRQEYWSGLPFPSPGDLPDPGIKLGSPVLQVDTLPSEPPGNPWMAQGMFNKINSKHLILHSQLATNYF